MCFQCLDRPSRTKVTALAQNGQKNEAWACLCGRLLPHIIMSQREIPRDAWTVRGNEEGSKPAIYSPGYEKKLGYNVARDRHLVTMAFALGPGPLVANVGCDVRRISLPPKISISVFVESLSHKITPLERSFLSSDQGEEVVLRRLFILWTLKEAYLKAIGQPLHLGIEWDRIECDIPNETIMVDGEKLRGWEFRMFKANVSIDPRKEEMYQVTCAVHRGGDRTRFMWNQKSSTPESWLRFVTVDSIMDAVWDLPYTHIIDNLNKR